MGQGVDHLDDPLGHGVARGGLGAEEEQVGGHLHVGVIPELLIEMDDVHHVQQLALVLVEALHLHVKDGVGVQDDPLFPLGVLGEGHLVGLLDVLEVLQHSGVVGVGVQLLQGGGVGQIVRAAGEVPDQAVQARVDLAEPAAVVDAVGHVLEFIRLHDVGVVEHVVLQNLAVEGGDAVDSHAAGDAEVGHAHLAAPDHRHVGGLVLVVIELLHLLLPAAGDLRDNLPHTGQQGLHQILRPALQSLRQHGVVGIGHRVDRDLPSLIPAEARVVDEDAHQLGDHQGGVGVVDLDHVLLMEVLQGAEGLNVLADNGLHGGGDEEVLLL